MDLNPGKRCVPWAFPLVFCIFMFLSVCLIVLFAVLVTHLFFYKSRTGIIRKIEERRLIQIDFLLYASPDSKLSNRKRGQRKKRH